MPSRGGIPFLVVVFSLLSALTPIVGGAESSSPTARAHEQPWADRVSGAASSATKSAESSYCAARVKGVLDALAASPDNRVTYMVVTLPKLGDAGVDSDFDQGLSAVSAAIENAGYTRDNYFMPWRERSPPSGLVQATSAIASAIDKRDPGAYCGDDEPGVFLFRGDEPGGDPDAPRFLVLLVVPEVPTSGMAPKPLKRALHLAQCGPRIECRCPSRSIHLLLAPYFSGSALSLRTSLDEWQTACPSARVDIVSGTATGDAVAKTLASTKVALSGSGRFQRRFQRTTLPDKVLLRRFYRWLVAKEYVDHPDDGLLRDVAMLSESGTSYGDLSGGDSARTSRQTASKAPDIAAKRIPRCVGAQISPLYEPILSLRFPLHIGDMRQRYGASIATQPNGVPEFVPMTSIAPRLDDGQERADTPPAMSPQTAVSDDLVLAGVFRTLADNRIRIVGITATDSDDVVFIAERLRQHLPNVRIFIPYSDVLFQHPTFASSLRGSWLVSPYPTMPETQQWYPWEKDFPAFPTSSAQGLYNAASALLSESRKGGDAVTSESAVVRPSPSQYGPPFEDPSETTPPIPQVWISVVGNGAAWPVDVLTPDILTPIDDEAIYRFAKGAEGPSSEQRPALRVPPAGWHTAAIFILSICVLLALGIIWAVSSSHPPEVLGELEAFGVRPGEPKLEAWTYRIIAVLALVGIIQIVTVTEYKANPSGHHVLFGPWAVIAWIVLALVLPTLAFRPTPETGKKILKEALKRLTTAELRPDAAKRPLAWLFVALLPLAGCWGASLWSSHDDSLRNYLYFYRAASLDSQVSTVPAAILGLTALFLLAWVALVRVRLAATNKTLGADWMKGRREALPDEAPADREGGFLGFLSDMKGAPSHRPQSMVLLARRLACSFDGRAAVPALVLLAGLAFWFWELDRVYLRFRASALDGGDECILRAGYIAGATLSVYCLVRVWPIWVCLRDHLQEIGDQPIGLALQRLSPVPSDHGLRLPPPRPFGTDQVTRMFELAKRLAENGEWIHPAKERFLSGIGVSLVPRDDMLHRLARFVPVVEVEYRAEVKYRAENERPAWVRRATDSWVQNAEEFLASGQAMAISSIMEQIRHGLALVLVSAMLACVAIASYPLQPHRLLGTLTGLGLLTAGSATVVVFVQMQRDTALSHLAKTTPGEVWDRHFVGQLAVWVFLPFLAYLATQFPEAATHVVGWVRPMLASRGG
jgi:hypothetical protein